MNRRLLGGTTVVSTLALVGLVQSGLAGCSDSTTSTSMTPANDAGTSDAGKADGGGTDAAAVTAKVRLIHASPDAPAVDVYIKGTSTPATADLTYQETTEYTPVPAGSYTFELRVKGAAATSDPAFTSEAITVPASGNFTIVATGLLKSDKPEDKFRLIVLQDSFGANEAGKIRVRVLHASPSAPTVALDVGDDSAGTPEKIEVKALERFKDTGADGVALPADTETNLGVFVGTTSGSATTYSEVTAFTLPKLPAGSNVLAVVSGNVADKLSKSTAVSIIAALPTTAAIVKQQPIVHPFHGSPDAPAVDIYAGTTKLWSNIAFGKLGDAQQFPPSTYTLDFKAAGSTGDAAATAKDIKLEAGNEYLAIATGFLSTTDDAKKFKVVAFAEGFENTDAAKGVVRVVHASPDTPALNIGPLTGTTLSAKVFENVSYPTGTAAAGTALAAGPITLGFAPASPAPGTTAVAKATLTIAAAKETFVVAAGTFANPTPANQEALKLFAVETTGDDWSVSNGIELSAP